MTKNGLDIQTISTKPKGFQTDRVLLYRQLTEKKEKANPSHFLKILIASRTNVPFFANAQGKNSYFVPLVNNIL